jgi:hypothetical protein
LFVQLIFFFRRSSSSEDLSLAYIFVRTLSPRRLIHFLLIVAPATDTVYFFRARFISLSGRSPSAREAFRHSKVREVLHLPRNFARFRFENRRRSYRREDTRLYSRYTREGTEIWCLDSGCSDREALPR